MGFWLPWVSIFVSVFGFYYVSKLVAPSAILGDHGKVTSYFTYVIVNVSFTVLLSSALQSFAGIVRRDQMAGTLEPILVSSAGVPVVILSSGLWSLLISCLQVVLYLVLAAWYGVDFRYVNLPALATFLALGLACMASLGVMAAAAVIAYKQTPPSGFLVGSAASLLAGVMFPVALLPPALQLLSWCLPLTHALAGMRRALSGTGLGDLAGDALWLAAATAILIPLSFLMLTRSIARAKRDGTLAYY